MSKRVWYVYGFIVAVYILLVLLVPADVKVLERYDITARQLSLLKLTLAIPLAAIWFAAFYGYDRFKNYAENIGGSADGRAFNYIANGLGLLAISLPVTTILSSIFDIVTQNSPGALPATTIVSNYVSVVIYLAAFWLVYRGSGSLVGLTHDRWARSSHHNLVMIATVIIGVLYTHFTLQNPNRRQPMSAASEATFYLSDWMILLTIIIPYVVAWFVGFYAALNIIRYTKSVPGVLYRQLMGYLAKGLVAIVLLSILLQFLEDFAHLFADVSLTPLLGIVYLLLLGYAVGYIYVAVGAKRLQKIEEA